jgi:prepilin-type N-terminal cleavage/methylation domain-containing protein
MNKRTLRESGFTLVEIAIVLLIVSILLGYTVAMFPRQQELKQYRALSQEMDQIIEAIVGFAQVNGRLPCPTNPILGGSENGGGDTNNCSHYGGFVPVNTLGLTGKLNADNLLLDPWGNPYRYYVSNSDFNGNGEHDFVRSGEMRSVGLVDSDSNNYIDLDGIYIICDDNGTDLSDECTGAAEVFGNAAGAGGPYAGAPFVLVSMGKNWSDTPINDELENRGGDLSTTDLGMLIGPSTNEYFLKDVTVPETTFIRRPTGFAEDFDDVVRWVSPNILYSKMIEAGQLP